MKQFDISGMSCAACSARVEKAVSSTPGVDSCAVNLLTNSMTVEGSASDEIIIAAVEKAGYGASLKTKNNNKNVNKDSQKATKSSVLPRLIASVVLLIPLMYITMGHLMLNAPLPASLATNPMAIALIEMLISGVILVINQRFFISGFRATVNLSPNMDTLVALGSGVSYLYSVVIVFSMTADGGAHHLHHLYFESAAMILTLITVGKMLEERAKGRTTDAISSLISLSPKTATVIRGGVETTIPSSDVRVGDVFVLRPGESVPVDGVVIEGESSVNEAALTGESVPVDKHKGDRVLCATLNQSGFLRCEATRVGEDTAIASVIKMVEDASATKAPIAKLADKVSGIFVPVVIGIATLTFVIWMLINGDPSVALSRGISVLVISCPCALGLATPVAIMVGSGKGARGGILFKTASSLENTGKTEIAVLDKTGTVTQGKPCVTDIIPAEGVAERELLTVAYSIEKMSEHPLGRAVADKGDAEGIEAKTCEGYKTLAGNGVFAYIEGEECYGASLRYISDKLNVPDELSKKAVELSKKGATPLVFTLAKRVIGIIGVSDVIKPDSRIAVEQLKNMGLRVVMLTGDNEITARKIAADAGIEEVIAGVLPDGKEKAVASLKKEGRVAMVGDGINDAPALAAADTGIAIGAGSDVAIDAADVVLVNSSLLDLAAAVRLSRRTLRNIYENLFWAFIYNAVGIPLAAGALSFAGIGLTPMFGAAAMSLSSFCVVSNALRLNLIDIKSTKRDKKIKTKNKKTKETKTMEKTMKIEGMMCPHCEARVKKCLEDLPEVKEAIVSHEKDEAVVILNAEISDEKLKETVEAQGYKVL